MFPKTKGKVCGGVVVIVVARGAKVTTGFNGRGEEWHVLSINPAASLSNLAYYSSPPKLLTDLLSTHLNFFYGVFRVSLSCFPYNEKKKPVHLYNIIQHQGEAYLHTNILEGTLDRRLDL